MSADMDAQRKQRLQKILYHVGRGIWKQIPFIGPIVDEVVYSANRDSLISAIEERTAGLTDEELARLEDNLSKIEDRIATALTGLREDIRADLAALERSLQTPALYRTLDATKDALVAVGAALSDYYAAALRLRLALTEVMSADPDVRSHLGQRLPPELLTLANDAASCIDTLGASLAALQRNELAYGAWRGAASNGGLHWTRDRLVTHGFEPHEVDISVADIGTLRSLFKIAADRLRQGSFDSLITASLATNLSQRAGQAYDHAALRALMFAGNVLFNLTQPSKRDESVLLVASFGTAIILDVSACIEKFAIPPALVASRFPEQPERVKAEALRIDTAPLLSNEIRFALDTLQQHTALLVLEAGEDS